MEGPWSTLPAQAAACVTDAQCVTSLQTLHAACVVSGECAADVGSGVAALVASSGARNRLASCQQGVCRCAWGLVKDGMSCLEPTAHSTPLGLAHAAVALLALGALALALRPLVVLRSRGALPLRAAEATTLLACAALLLLAATEGAWALALLRPTLLSVPELEAGLAAALFFMSAAALRLAGIWAALAAAARGAEAGGRTEALLRSPAAAYGVAGAWLVAVAALVGASQRAAALALTGALALLLLSALVSAAACVHFLFERDLRPRSCLGRSLFFVDALLGAPFTGAPLSALANSSAPESAAALAKRGRASTRRSSEATLGPLDERGALDARSGGGKSMRRFSSRVLACAFRLVLALVGLAGCAALLAAQTAGRGGAAARWAALAMNALACVALMLVCGFFAESYRVRRAQLKPARALSPRSSLSAVPDTRLISVEIGASRANGSGVSARSSASGASSPAGSPLSRSSSGASSGGGRGSDAARASPEDPAGSAAEAVRRHARRTGHSPSALASHIDQ